MMCATIIFFRDVRMYIKMSFSDEFVIVPATWEGLVVAMDEGTYPEILDELPENIKANQPSNIRYFDTGELLTLEDWKNENKNQGYHAKKYDYYYDCGTMSAAEIKQGITEFMKKYADNLDARLAGNGYPEMNPAFELLKRIFNDMLRNEKMIHGYAVISFFAVKLDDDFRDGAMAPSPRLQ